VQLAPGGGSGCAGLAVIDFGAYEAAGAVAEAPVVSADLDGDGLVGFTDLLVLLSAWGDVAGCQLVDLNGDGTIGFGDLIILLASWTP